MDAQSQKERAEFVEKYMWMVRSCHLYKIEAAECKSLKGRFQQYFIDGSFEDCNSWVHDSRNCTPCVAEKKVDACYNIIINENRRLVKRLKPHFDNDVWEKRKEPPENWVRPLPEWWEEQNKDSILVNKAKEFEETYNTYEVSKPSICVIL